MQDPAAQLMRGLTEALVLESLHQEPRHGYGLMQELEEVFGEAPNRNRIYPLLSRLEEEGYIRGQEDPDSSRGKTTYTLTEAGEDRLETYRTMPDAFRETLGRFWGAPTGDEGGSGKEEGDDGEDSSGEGDGEGGDESDDAPETGDPGGEGSELGDEAREEDGGGGDPSGGGGDGRPRGAPSGGGPGGMDLRRNPETGEVEMVIRGTHWGEVRIELGEIKDAEEE